MKFLYGTILVMCLCHALHSAPVASTDDDDQQKLNDLAAELKQLQKQFSTLQNVKKPVSSDGSNQDAQPAARKPTQNDIVIPSGDDKEKIFEPRGVGWQPLKRLAEDSHNSPTFQLSLKDQTSLKQQIINAVEEHLLEDLQSAQQYGIEPQQILSDLRQKNIRS